MQLIHGGLEGKLVQPLLRGAGRLEEEEEEEGRQEKRVEEEEEAGDGEDKE